MKHTELPWKANKEGIRVDIDGLFGGECDIIHDPQFDTVCFAPKENNNAEFIVKACNNHYKLVEAVKYALDNVPNDNESEINKAYYNEILSDIEGK